MTTFVWFMLTFSTLSVLASLAKLCDDRTDDKPVVAVGLVCRLVILVWAVALLAVRAN